VNRLEVIKNILFFQIGARVLVASKNLAGFFIRNLVKSMNLVPARKTEMHNPSCGVIRKWDGKEEIVLVGGFNLKVVDTVEIYSPEESRWRSGERNALGLVLLY
jgi:hypothetical protein